VRPDAEDHARGVVASSLTRPRSMEPDRITLLEQRVATLETENARLRDVELTEAHQRIDALLGQLSQMAERMERQVQHDGLTGLANNRNFDARLEHEFARVRRFGHELSVAIVDIDDFQALNNRYSRVVGDMVLQTVAQILRHHCRSIDVVARYGADEFVVLLMETSESGAERVCENFRLAVEGFDWGILHPELEVSVSIGAANHHDASGSEELMGAVAARLESARRARRAALAAQ
jgi:diguanylate cyclase (GGDEF)-like protein